MLFALLMIALASPGLPLKGVHQDPVLPEINSIGPKTLPGADVKALVRGQLPKNTSDEAKQRFTQMTRSTWSGEKAPEGLRSFMVTFDARVRATSTGSNDMRTTFLYLEEGRGFVRGFFPKSGRVSVRGPEGDWLLDGKEVLDLSDHSNRESRREHERWLALARNFATLSSPSDLRMGLLQSVKAEGQGRELKIGEALPVQFPTLAQAERARGLEWLLMTTPDFNLLASNGPSAALRQVRLGLDAASGRVRFALIEGSGGPQRPQAATDPILVEIPAWISLGQRLLPKQILVHRSFLAVGPQDPTAPIVPPTRLSFEELPGVDLFLVESESQPDMELTPGDFARPVPR